MQVKLELNSFNGHAELSGVELDNLTKILTKFFGTDERYLDGRYIQVKTGQKLTAKLEISVGTEFMTESNYQIEKASVDARGAAKAEEERQNRQLAAEIASVEQTDAAKDALVKCLIDQAKLYWHEQPDHNPIRDWCFDDGMAAFTAGEVQRARRIIIHADGTFERIDL